jgi:hypothetical protein
MERPKRLFRRVPGSEDCVTDAMLDQAESRHQVFCDNEFKIRMLKQEATKLGYGDDMFVAICDVEDRIGKQIYRIARNHPNAIRLGQPTRPGDRLQLVVSPYREYRENFSPTHRRILDACPPADIRVALFSRGRTTVIVLPNDVKLDDMSVFFVTQDEESRKLGRELPPEILDAMIRNQTKQRCLPQCLDCHVALSTSLDAPRAFIMVGPDGSIGMAQTDVSRLSDAKQTTRKNGVVTYDVPLCPPCMEAAYRKGGGAILDLFNRLTGNNIKHNPSDYTEHKIGY